MVQKKYTCPCCGYLVFEEEPGNYDICPICGWEDDIAQLRFVTLAGGANKPSLLEAQKNFAEFGASDKKRLGSVREPRTDDFKNPDWRPFNLAIDKVENLSSEDDTSLSYPDNPTELYYWK